MKLFLATLALVALAFVGVALLAGGSDREAPPSTAPGSDEIAAKPVVAPKLTAEQINRQDPPDPRREREESRAFDRRQLLNVLPATVHGVGFEIGGLDADGRTTIVLADRNGQRLRQVRAAYETLLRSSGDRSGAYRLVIRP